MPEINANIVVEPINLTIESNDPGITVSPEPLNLNIYTGGIASPAGNIGDIQYNAGGVFGGIPTANYIAGNLSLGAVGNVKITGGNNAYYLQTDGTGNLSWVVGAGNVTGNGTAAGANTQIQFTDGAGNFLAAAGFTFDNASNTFSAPGLINGGGNLQVQNANLGNVATANYFNGIFAAGNSNIAITTNGNIRISPSGSANLYVFGLNDANFVPNLNLSNNFTVNGDGNIVGNLKVGAIANGNSNITVLANSNIVLTSMGNSSLTVTNTGIDVNGDANTVNLNVSFKSNLNNIANVIILGGANGQFLKTDGLGNLTFSNVDSNYANFAGTVLTNAQPNITSVGNLVDLRIDNDQIHLGNLAGNTSQGNYSIAIGRQAAETSQGNSAVAIGFFAGETSQKDYAVAIGESAGRITQGTYSVSIGENAGTNAQGNFSVAVGPNAGAYLQGANAIAIGYKAGEGSLAGPASQAQGAIAIGTSAGVVSEQYAIAIGFRSGQTVSRQSSIALGSFIDQVATNCIVLNATGTNLNSPAVANTFTVKPIRNATSTNTLYYNNTTGEVTYNTPTYGAFYNPNDIAITANTVANLALPNVSANSGVYIASSDRITIPVAGTYNIQFSLQLLNTDNAAEHEFDVWFAKNGNNIADSATRYTVIKNNGKAVAALNFVDTCAANDYYQIRYAATSANISLEAFANISTPYVRPAIPSAIVTVVPVGA